MRILFTKLRHIGDNLLITPIIVATKRKFPDAEIWVAVRRGTAGILAGCPEIDRIIVTARPEEGRRTWRDFGSDLRTLAEVIRTPFDFAIELGDNDRGRTLVAASGAPIRATHVSDLGLSPFWSRCFTHVVTQERSHLHQVEMDYMTPREVLGLPEEIPPLRFDSSATHPWQPGTSLEPGSFAVLHAATRWHCKSWPLDRWRKTLERILKFTPRVIVSCGPAPEEIAEAQVICRGFEERTSTTGGRASWRELAWLLERARYYVGVDTAAMHLAAAMQCPIVSLFGHSVPGQFGPWKCPMIMAAPAGRQRGEPSKTPGVPDNDRMLRISVEEVVESCWEISNGNRAMDIQQKRAVIKRS
jgi:heptosyltransferase-3